jgi:arylsulfatase
VGVRSWTGKLPNNCTTIAELLHENGYTTMMVGRMDFITVGDWYEPTVAQRYLDHFFGSNGHTGPGNYFKAIRGSQILLDGKEYQIPKEGFYYTDAMNDYAVKFLEQAVGKDRPFFLYAAQCAPHWPLHAKPEDIAKYREKYRKQGWDKLRKSRRQRLFEMGLVDERTALSPRDKRVPAWEEAKDKDWEAERMAVYAAQIDCLDHGVGRILTKLKQMGAEDNTLIVFLSDNGASDQGEPKGWFDIPNWRLDGQPTRWGNSPSIMPGPAETFCSYGPAWANVSNTPFREYKGTNYEGGISTPLIARWPGVIRQGGAITHQTGHIIDIMATYLDVAGIEYPGEFAGRKILPMEGKSLLPIFEGKRREGHKALYWELSGHRAMRMGNWKLTAMKKKGWELYNLETDRSETNNLADKYPQKVEQMKKMYETWARRCGV